MTVDDIGRFPCDGPSGRATGTFHKVTRADCLKTVFGRDYPVKMHFFVSNDVVHMGEMLLPSGGVGSRASEPSRFEGDACFHVRSGPMTFFLPDSGEVFHVREGQTLFLPGGTAHQIINYNGHVVRAVFAVAPEL